MVGAGGSAFEAALGQRADTDIAIADAAAAAAAADAAAAAAAADAAAADAAAAAAASTASGAAGAAATAQAGVADVTVAVEDTNDSLAAANGRGDALSAAVQAPGILAGGISPGWLSPFDGDDVTVPWFSIIGTITPAVGRAALMYIRLTKDRTFTVLRFAGGNTFGSAPTNLYVGLYKVDPSTNLRTKIYDSGDIRGTIASMQIGAIYNVVMPTPVVGRQGDIFAVAVLPVGGTAPGYQSTGLSGGGAQHPAAYIQSIGLDFKTGLSTLPATISTTTPATTSEPYAIWAAIGDTAPPRQPAYVYDFFSGADTNSDLGPNWIAKFRSGGTTDLGRLNGAVRVDDNDEHLSAYVGQMSTPNHRVRITNANPSSPDRLYLPLRCSDTATCWGVWDLFAGTARIMTATAWGVTGTQRAIGAAPPGWKWLEFQADGNVYTLQGCDNNNNVQAPLVWTDGGGAHPTGETQRVVGMGMAGGVSLFTGYIADWVAQDI